MSEKDESLLVKVIKKAVGLPTGSSSCGCGTPAPAASGCCGPIQSADDEPVEIPASGRCGCGSNVDKPVPPAQA